MYGQKSPYARVRQTSRVRSRKPSRRPCSSQPVSEEYAKEASEIRGDAGDLEEREAPVP
ncbi:hypothetical protein SFUMM280S_09679 [Streptomyces fumanus]